VRRQRTPPMHAGITVATTLAAAAMALAGCTSSAPASTDASPSGHPSPAITLSPSPTHRSPVSSRPAASTSAAAASAAPAASAKPSAPATGPAPPGLATCASAQLGVRVLRGGAVAGQEFALITFTNTSTTGCVMFGYPGVSLRLQNALLGKPAERSIKKPTTVPLAPGAAAQAMITDFSACQAPVSDTVRVYAPDQTAFVDKPLELRGCRIFIDSVGPSS
jgi:Protein of unknown function (DUF4232)